MTPEVLEKGYAWLMEHYVSRHRDVLVHCSCGIHRSPLMVVYFIHRYTGDSIDQAYALVQRLRPIVEHRKFWFTEACHAGCCGAKVKT